MKDLNSLGSRQAVENEKLCIRKFDCFQKTLN